MGWRRGELWLDTDILWFGEGPGAPAVAFPPPSALGPEPPPGLAASRRRRDGWRRRREARRARAKALALSPAVMLALAGARSDDHETSIAVEDPPSLTFGLGTGTAEAADSPRATVGHDRVTVAHESPAISKPKRPDRSVARANTFPKIEWHHAISVGLPYGGSLIDGTQLPVESPSWVTWNPVTDSVPNAPNRLYGNERTIRAIVTVTEAYRAAHPEAARVVIGDISREGGGPMRDEHVSHQNGLDVDVYFPRLDRTLRAPRAPDEIDHRLAQDLLDRFVAAGAQMVFVGYSTGLHGPAGVVIPYPGHEYHMHVRFPPPGA
jgi:Penicillin-insensitive murein endopeptidase